MNRKHIEGSEEANENQTQSYLNKESSFEGSNPTRQPTALALDYSLKKRPRRPLEQNVGVSAPSLCLKALFINRRLSLV